MDFWLGKGTAETDPGNFSRYKLKMKRGVCAIYLSLRTHGQAAVDLGAESGGRLRRPPRPASLVAPLGGRPGGILQGAIPS
jgi:hypothetical protein